MYIFISAVKLSILKQVLMEINSLELVYHFAFLGLETGACIVPTNVDTKPTLINYRNCKI